MAIVPRKVEADVSLAPLSGARYIAPQRTGGMEVAQSVARFGAALGDYANTQDQIDATLDSTGARTLDTQAMGQLNSIQTDFLSKRGLQAGIARPDAEKAVNDARTAILAKATTPRMKAMVGRILDQRTQTTLNTIASHSVGQLQVAGDESLKARFGLSAETAIMATDPDEREKNIQTGLGDIAKLGESQGWSQEALQAEQLKYRSGINRGVIRNLIDGDNVTGAIAYRDLHAKELTADDDAMIDGMLRDPIQTRQATADLAAGMSALSGGTGVGGKPSAGAAGGATAATGTTPAPGLTAPKAPTSVSPDVVFNAGLIPQESGGRPGIAGPMTQYGQAHGLTQLLDGTGQQMAKKLGVPWRPDLLRGTSTEAINYQKKLGREYFNEGLDKYDGDVRKALMYYHGGPDQSKWGPKTRAYASSIMNRLGLDPGQGASASGTEPKSGADLEKLDTYFDSEVSAGRMSPERADRAKNLARQRVSLANAVRSEKENEAERSALDAIDKIPGQKLTDWGQIPPEVRASLSPEARVRFDNVINENNKVKPTAPNGDAVINLHQMLYLDPKRFKETDLRAYRSMMTSSEYDDLSTQQAKLLATPNTSTDGNAAWSVIERYGPDIGIDMAPMRKGENQDAFTKRRADGMRLYSTMRARLNYITNGGQREATPDEVKGAFDYSIMNVQRVTKGTLWGENTEDTRFYRTNPGDKLRTELPDTVRARILSAYGQRGMKLSDEQIYQIYINNKGKPGYW